jgi:hypothetical protein
MRIHGTAFFAIAVTLAASCALTSCASDPMSTTCRDYLGKTEAEQLDLAALWAQPVRDKVTAIGRSVAPVYRRDLIAYCPSHRDARLKDLDLRIKPS